MQAHIQPDPSRGAGYGIIDLEGFEGQDVDILFSLRRASDRKYLGSNDWQETEQRLEPDMVQRRDDVLRLLVGPAVVDKMVDVLDAYAITAYPADGEGGSCALEVGNLVYSALAGGQGVSLRESAPPPMPERRLAPVPKPEPEPAPEPESVPQPAPEPQPEPSPAPQPLPEPPLPPLRDPVKPRSKTPLLLLLLLVLAASAAGVYWKQSASTPPAAAGASAQSAPPAVSTAPPAVQRAREALRRGISPEEAMELAKDLYTPDGADGAFLLLEEAALKGKTEAMLNLARFYDPTDTAPKGTIRPDAEQAREWYAKAKDGGQGAADDRLKALRAWAEANKDKDPQAQKLLEIWK
jgi:hypothetical protein